MFETSPPGVRGPGLPGGPVLRIALLFLLYGGPSSGDIQDFGPFCLAPVAPDQLIGKQPHVVLLDGEGFDLRPAVTAQPDD